MKNKERMLPCPCCGNYTVKYDTLIVDICPVCFWQYDIVAQEHPDRVIGPNHGLSLNLARENYKCFGAINREYIQHVRKPLPEEMPENNR